MGNANEIGIGELDAGAFVAIVEQYLEPGLLQPLAQRVRHAPHLRGLGVVQRHDVNVEWRHRRRPNDAGVVVALLHHGRHGARDAEAVTAHHRRHPPAGGVLDGNVQGARVLGAQLEDVAHFDAAQNRKGAAAVRCRIPGNRLAHIHHLRIAHVARPIDANVVVPVLVGAADETRKRGGAAVHENRQAEAAWPDGAKAHAQRAAHVFFGSESERAPHAGQVRRFGLAELVVAAQHQRGQSAVLRANDKRLHATTRGNAKQLRYGVYRAGARRRHLSQGLRLGVVGKRRRRRLLHIGRVVAGRAVRQLVLAVGREHMELVRFPVAHGAGIRVHRPKREADAT